MKIGLRMSYCELEDVCLDCADNLKPPIVECEECPVNRLKELAKKKKEKLK